MSCNETSLLYPNVYGTLITSQDDIDRGALLAPNATTDSRGILVTGVKGSLTFTNLTAFYKMAITCNNHLQEINFPETVMLGTLVIDTAPNLERISMNKWNGSADTTTYRVAPYGSLSISKAPRLGLGFQQAQQFNMTTLSIVDLNGVGGVQFPQLISAITIYAQSSSAQFPKLVTVSDYLLIGSSLVGNTNFPSLKDVGKLRISNQTSYGYNMLAEEDSTGPLPDLAVRESVIIEGQIRGQIRTKGDDLNPKNLVLNQLTTVGEDLNITKNNGVAKMSFSRLEDVKRLYIKDNLGSVVPGDFSRLTTANLIHVNGVLDNNTVLFPRLSSANEVRIEAWNPEFDCSWLVRMRDLGKIAVLSCNGTNGTYESPKDDSTSSVNPTNPTTSSSSSGGLSTGAFAGIGTGVGVSVLGVLAVLVWFILRYRRKLRGLAEESHNHGRDDPKEATRETPTPRENLLDGTQIEESGGRSMPHQSGGTEILEAGGRALRAEAGDGRGADGAVVAQEKKSPPLELP
ncbi:hypothetical protein PG991_008419 [Apiospora marii]|uniref:Receptor L-domain domain-containing protein n=1 Tax=Apiospora marii TaxID=335849 RepID=A0ABR1RLQ8_9PEZI